MYEGMGYNEFYEVNGFRKFVCFYLDSDGWHFVYNAGEIDSLSTGVIDVVIARTFLKEKINGE